MKILCDDKVNDFTEKPIYNECKISLPVKQTYTTKDVFFFQNNLIRIIIYPNLHTKKDFYLFFFMHNYAEKNY